MSCELEIYRLKSGDDNSFLRGFDLIYTILLSLFELGLSSERKASHERKKWPTNNEIQEVLTSFETRNYNIIALHFIIYTGSLIFYRGRPFRGLPQYDYIIIYDEEMLCEVVDLSKVWWIEVNLVVQQQWVNMCKPSELGVKRVIWTDFEQYLAKDFIDFHWFFMNLLWLFSDFLSISING